MERFKNGCYYPFKYSDNGACGFIRDLADNTIIIHGNGTRAMKFLKWAVKLINERFEEEGFHDYEDVLSMED